MLWQSVRRQLPQLAADMEPCWDVRIPQLGMLLQDFLPKLNVCSLGCGAIYSEASMANNSMFLLRSTKTMWGSSMTVDSVPPLRHSVRRQPQGLVADRQPHLIVRLVYLALPLQHFLLKVGICWVRH